MKGICGALTFLTGLGLLLAPPPLAAQQPRAERPTYAVGERWIRSDGVFDLVRIEDGRYIFASPDRREIHLSRDLGLAKILKATPVTLVQWEFDPPIPLEWPLEVGKSGSKQATWRTPRSPGGLTSTIQWTVEAHEDVRVTAGTFKAFRVRVLIEFQAPARRVGSREYRLWYAPDARQFVKGEGADLGNLNFQVVAVEGPGMGAPQVAARPPAPRSPPSIPPRDVAPALPAGASAPGAAAPVVSSPAPPAARPTPAPPSVAAAPAPPVSPAPGVPEPAARTGSPAPAASTPPSAAIATAPSSPAGSAPTPPSLRIALAAPMDQARVDQASIAVAGLVSGGRAPARVVVTLNGVEVIRQEKRGPALPVNLPITLREGQNTLVLTATDADGMIQQEVRTVHYDRPTPLAVDFRFPPDQARLTEPGTVVVAIAASGGGVAEVRVTLNGAEVHRQAEQAGQRSAAVTAPVTLRDGPNAIVVTARGADGTVRQEARTVFFDRPKAAAPPAPPHRPEPDRWAVVVGIGRYEHPGISKLRYTVPDAEAFYQVLTGPAGFKKDRVLLLTDQTERKPTLRNLRWALGTFLARTAKKEDVVVIFFAGHGAPETDPRGLERDGLAKYLIPTDADPEDLYSTALPMDELQTIFGRIEAERVVVFLDACYSGAAGGRTFASLRTRASNLDDFFLERLTRARGRAIITASRPAELSIELPELGHGVFSYYLVRGMHGAADLNRDGIVTLQELYEYVEQQVSQKARAVGGRQHPVMKGELEGMLPLAKVGGK